MSIEIRRPATDEEWTQHAAIAAYAFNSDRTDAGLQHRGAYYDRDWALAAFEGGEMAAGLVVIPFEQYIEGASIPTGGVASVSCLPERRRGGYTRTLLRHALQTMRDAGQPLSMLWTPHYSLYRRFGWEIAARMMSYSFPPKTVRPRRPASAGRWERLSSEPWPRFDALYTRHHAARNGAFRRTERHWRHSVFEEFGTKSRDAAIWSNAAGEDRAYAIYGAHHRQAGNSPFGETVLRVHDWVALDGEACTAVLGYVLSHDLVTRIVMTASEDDRLPDAIEEPAHISEPVGVWFGPMLRLVDVQRAIEARPAPPHASGTEIVVSLTDETAPWNAGTWRVAAHEGRLSAERTTATPGIETDVAALAPIYNGFTRPTEAVRAGTVRASSDAAIDAATRLFATTFSPYCPDDF
jgi:predicted acetyltransferase